MLKPQAGATRQPRMRRADPPVLVRLPTSGRPAVVPLVINGRRNLPGVCWSVGRCDQPQK
jgi:hypothetical protein